MNEAMVQVPAWREVRGAERTVPTRAIRVTVEYCMMMVLRIAFGDQAVLFVMEVGEDRDCEVDGG